MIGANADQNSIAPAVTLASVVIDLPHALLSIAREVREGLFVPRVVKLGTTQQVVKLIINPALGSQIPTATRFAVDSVQRLILTGKFAVPLDTTLTAQVAASAEEQKPAAAGDSVASNTAPPASGADTAAKDAPTAAAAGVH